MFSKIETFDNETKFIKANKYNKNPNQKVYLIFIFLFVNLFFYFQIINKKENKNLAINISNRNIIIKLKDEIFNKKQNRENNLFSKNNLIDNSYSENEDFDENIQKKIVENQYYFCKNKELFFDSEIDKNLMLVKANLKNISFNMFVYKSKDTVSKNIMNFGYWEKIISINLINGLNYYSKKKNLPKNEITILDIGANIGWYSYYLGKAGYEIIAFEVSHINNYILKRNYCLNKEINITLINKGIGLKEERCILHHPSANIGNAVILCGENINIANKKENLIEEIKFTKLSNYISYLSKKNLAIIKIDIEGSEGKAVSSGIELISRYHIPFLLIEFNKNYLKMQGTDPKAFLQLFENNNYKFSTESFLSKNYLSIDEILRLPKKDLYIIYSNFIDNNF